MAARYRTPYLEVTGPNGEDMLETWGSRLIGVKLIDRDGDVSDEGIFMFTRKPPYVSVPGELPTIVLKFDENYDFDVELEPRFQFQKVSASYLDTDKDTLEREDKTSGQGQNGDALPHPFPSKDAAAAAVASVAQAWQANAGQGMFTSHGLAEAVSGAPVKCQGYGSPIDETEWLASTVTHDINPGVGWDTTVETEVQSY